MPVTAKIRNLTDYHLRLLHGVVPPPSGTDIANTLKYFSQTLLGRCCISVFRVCLPPCLSYTSGSFFSCAGGLSAWRVSAKNRKIIWVRLDVSGKVERGCPWGCNKSVLPQAKVPSIIQVNGQCCLPLG